MLMGKRAQDLEGQWTHILFSQNVLAMLCLAGSDFGCISDTGDDRIQQQLYPSRKFACLAVIGWRDKVHPAGIEQLDAGFLGSRRFRIEYGNRMPAAFLV